MILQERRTVLGTGAGRLAYTWVALLCLFTSVAYTGCILKDLFVTTSMSLPFRGLPPFFESKAETWEVTGLDELAPKLLAGEYRLMVLDSMDEFLKDFPPTNYSVYTMVSSNHLPSWQEK